MSETTSFEALAQLWQAVGGAPDALDRARLTGTEPALPCSFRVGTAAQAAIAAAGLAAAEIWREKTGRAQVVAVDMHHAAIEVRSERYLRVVGAPLPAFWDPLAGLYRAGDGRPVRLHTNFVHHRDAVLTVLGCEPSREAVQAALNGWSAVDFETAAHERGGAVAAFRSAEEWAAHPQGQAVAELPILTIERIGDAPPRPLPAGERPLSGLRVLDLTRIIAGPVAGRTLAAHGGDVLLITAPQLPAIDWLVKDTGRGKLSAQLDLASEAGRAALRGLLAEADIFLQGYRPGGLDRLGFSPEAAAEIRPGIIYASLSAYGAAGPWAGRRGFDSLVQTASGFNHAEGRAAGIDGPKELPAQALDHAAGYLLALGAMTARLRQTREGGSWLVRVSLAQTGRWIWRLGRVENGLAAPDPSIEQVQDLLETSASPFGELRAVRHAAQLSETPAHWSRPSVPLGAHGAAWSQ
jgi:crotonobetainyl-CoA:carnitine CoA-transferase CaiB-like acyl-CoA transferase